MTDLQLILMLKEPVAGRVKTRLGRDIGVGPATGLYRALVRGLMREVLASGLPAVIAVDRPYAALRTSWHRRFGVPLIAQGRGDLGARLRRLYDGAPGGPVAFLGSDTPEIHAGDLRAAARHIHGHDAVFGPADDGGYWLAAFARRRPAPQLFHAVRWSTAHALNDTWAGLPAGARVKTLRTLGDIDTGRDLSAWRHRTRIGM